MSRADTERRVLISGAGIAGLTLGVLLKERGWHPLLVEKEPEPRREGYMMDFFGTGWDVAERMGLVDDLRAIDYPIERMEFVDRHGRAYVSVPLERISAALGGRYVYLRRPDLEGILRRRAEAADLDMRFGTSIEELQHGEDGVTVRLESGEIERFDLVFGADGVHSRVRQLVFGDEEALSFNIGGYVAAFHIEQSELRLDNAFKLHEEVDRLAAFYPLGGGAIDATFVLRHADIGHVAAEQRLGLLQQTFTDPAWIAKHFLEEVPDSLPVYFDSLTQIRMPAWHYGRVALIGDACGCLTLLAGQGSHMAMAGAYVLATELERHADHSEAFKAYERLMETAVMSKQLEAERFARLIMPTARSRPWLRRLATRLMFSRPGIRLGMRFFGARSVLDGYAES